MKPTPASVARALGVCLALAAVPAAWGELAMTGVSLAGAEFGDNSLPGIYNTHYTYPTAAEIDYYVAKGVNTFRLPFRWERLQRSLSADFDATELARLGGLVEYATSTGATVVLDPHNYARYRSGGQEWVVGSTQLPNAAFADFWQRLAGEFADNPRVVFGLMNEPNSMPTEQWASAANAAIAAIRDAGATNLILAPGNAWSGAHSWNQNWYGTPNAQVMLSITDPGDKLAFEVHQYLDTDSSGTSTTVVSETVGRDRLVSFTDWLRENNKRGFLGEFGVANAVIGDSGGQIGDEAIDLMLDYIDANQDVWLGWTWWAGGPWWGNYQFTIEPTNLGQPNQADRPSMQLLESRFVGVEGPLSGDFNQDGMVDAADYTVWRDGLGTTYAMSDYSLWRTNYGAGSPSHALAVPCPNSLSGVLAVTLLVYRRPRRRPSIR